MSALNTYRIPFIENAELTYTVELEKQANLMNVSTEINGRVFTICDRCGDPLEKQISGVFQLVVKFGDETSDVADDIIILGPAEHILNLDQLFYEYAHLCLSHKNVHESEDLCNQKAIETLREFELRESEELDPRWSKLKDLK